jgi:hypothetical protein
MIRDGKKSRAFVRKSGINPLDRPQVSCDKGASTGHNARMEGNEMARTIEQNAADMEIALMRMNQARDKLADAVIAGDNAAIDSAEQAIQLAADEVGTDGNTEGMTAVDADDVDASQLA